MVECKSCHLTDVPDHHNNYRVCSFCDNYFLCLTLSQEHYLKCEQRKAHIEKSFEKKTRIENQHQGGSRGNFCKSCHLTGVPDHHNNYRVCSFCDNYFLCLTLSQEHYLKCEQRKAHIEKPVKKKIRIEDGDQQQGGSRGNLEEDRVSFEPFQKQRTRKCFKELQR